MHYECSEISSSACFFKCEPREYLILINGHNYEHAWHQFRIQLECQTKTRWQPNQWWWQRQRGGQWCWDACTSFWPHAAPVSLLLALITACAIFVLACLPWWSRGWTQMVTNFKQFHSPLKCQMTKKLNCSFSYEDIIMSSAQTVLLFIFLLHDLICALAIVTANCQFWIRKNRNCVLHPSFWKWLIMHDTSWPMNLPLNASSLMGSCSWWHWNSILSSDPSYLTIVSKSNIVDNKY